MWWFFSLFLAVPILVHLFDFRKAKKIYFSSVKYISNLSSKTRSKSRLKYLLVLGNRLLIFGCILFSLWYLFFDRHADSKGPVYFYYDNSISASINDGNLTLEELIQGFIEKSLKPVYVSNNIESQQVNFTNDLSLSSSYDTRELNRVIEESNSRGEKNVFILSDFQLANPAEFSSFSIDSSKTYQIILLDGLNDYRNLFIDSLWLQTNPNDLSKLSIFVDFAKYNIESGSVVVKLMQGTRQLSSIVKDIKDLDVVEFSIPIDAYGQYILHIDGDDVLYDNAFSFVREVGTKPVISILNNGGSRAIGEVFNSSLFDSQLLNIQNLDYERLRNSDLIVFNNYYKLPSSLMDQFPDKYFLIFPPDSVDVQSYSQLDNLTFSNASDNQLEIEIISGNSLLQGVFDKNAQPGSMPSLSPVFNVRGTFEPIVKYRDNTPFLLSSDKKYVFNTVLGESSGFESNALFLPIIYQISFHSTGGLETPYYYPGNSIELDVKATDIPIKIVREGFEVIPQFNSAEIGTTIRIPSNIDPGIYHLVQGSDTLRQVAVNIPKEESVMVSASFEDLQLAFQAYDNVKVSQVNEGVENTVFASSERVGLWKYALILVLLLIFTETMLHRYFR